MAMSARDKMLLKWIVAAIVPLGVIVFYVVNVRPTQQAELQAAQVAIDSLRLAVDSARADLARGTVESLRQRVADDEASLVLMRELVPTGDEVANLIDDISNRAKLRNVTVSDLSPQGAEEQGVFRAARYRFVVRGRYDDVGGFLSDIASLPRIMVPRDVGLQRASGANTGQDDAPGALLEATFLLRTFVKPQSAVSDGEGAGGSR